jgi:hypothetical protein
MEERRRGVDVVRDFLGIPLRRQRIRIFRHPASSWKDFLVRYLEHHCSLSDRQLQCGAIIQGQ